MNIARNSGHLFEKDMRETEKAQKKGNKYYQSYRSGFEGEIKQCEKHA